MSEQGSLMDPIHQTQELPAQEQVQSIAPEDLNWDNVVNAATSESNKESNNKEAKEISESSEESLETGSTESQEANEEVGQSKADEKQIKVEQSINIEDLSDDTKVKVKINGKLEEVSLKDFKNGISGQKEIARRFTEYDKKEKYFKSEMEKVEKYISDLGSTMKNSSVLEGVYKIAEITRMPQHKVKEALIKELLPEIQRLSGLSPEQIELESARAEQDYSRKQLESDRKRFEQEQAQRDLQVKINSIRETHEISAEEWDDAVYALDASVPKNTQITADMVGEHVVKMRASTKAESVLTSFDSGKHLANKTLVNELQRVIQNNPDFTEQELKDLLSKALGVVPAKEIEEKVKKAVSVKKPNPKDQPKKELKPFMSWDEI